MPLQPGTQLGPYRIEAPLGAGGMGEVYRARDTRLDRTVAVKVLPAEISARPEVRERFEREARTISSLSHPHICALYDVGLQDGVHYLVMEFLEGETLAQRLQRQPLPPDQVLQFGIQIADALERAHRTNIVHRDLKPGNIMLTANGVKLLDFGLAKLVDAAIAPQSGVTVLATEVAQHSLTAEGTILGTLHYMAPEQLEGKHTDARTDTFALGLVLYEMATGRKAFNGESQASLIAAIMTTQPPPLLDLQPLAPPGLDRLIRTCLAKDPEQRFQSVHDVGLQLRWLQEGNAALSGSVAATSAVMTGAAGAVADANVRRQVSRWMAATMLLAVAAIGLAAALLLRSQPASQESRPMHLALRHVSDPPGGRFEHPALSADGARLAFVAPGREQTNVLWVRGLDQPAAQPMPGTEDASMPFWSPDGRFLGFFADGKLKKIDIAGGPPQTLCAASGAPFGASWNESGVILFAHGGMLPLSRVSAMGGAPESATEVAAPSQGHIWPSFLPDGQHFVFLADAATEEAHRLVLGSLDSHEVKDLGSVISNLKFVAPDLVLYGKSATLLAHRIDTRKFEWIGEPVALARELGTRFGHYYEFTASDTGTLVYRSASPLLEALWFDRAGNRQERVTEPMSIEDVEMSPDGARVVLEKLDADGRNEDLLLVDLRRRVVSRLTLIPGAESTPIWSRDGKQILFSASRSGAWLLYAKNALGIEAERQIAGNFQAEPLDTSPDGRTLLVAREADTGLSLLALDGSSPPRDLGGVLGQALGAKLSPDGRWIAVCSEESGTPEIYLRGLDDSGSRLQVSTAGGLHPRWRRDGREIFYHTRAGAIMAVDVNLTQGTEVSAPRQLFVVSSGIRSFDVSADGQRFLIVTPIENSSTVPFAVVLHWPALLPAK